MGKHQDVMLAFRRTGRTLIMNVLAISDSNHGERSD